MLLCEETLSVLDMLKPRVKLVEEACQCKYTRSFLRYLHVFHCHSWPAIHNIVFYVSDTFLSPQKERAHAQFLQAHP